MYSMVVFAGMLVSVLSLIWLWNDLARLHKTRSRDAKRCIVTNAVIVDTDKQLPPEKYNFELEAPVAGAWRNLPPKKKRKKVPMPVEVVTAPTESRTLRFTNDEGYSIDIPMGSSTTEEAKPKSLDWTKKYFDKRNLHIRYDFRAESYRCKRCRRFVGRNREEGCPCIDVYYREQHDIQESPTEVRYGQA